MKTLILCIDKDNDFGDKAGVATPIIGRENNMAAAVALALVDPEDADANSLFAAIAEYDRAVKGGRDAEIATVCGDRDSTQAVPIFRQQIDMVLGSVKPDAAILVSDGAEDESTYHIIGSRIKINDTRRIVIKQSQNIENNIQIFIRTMKEEKIRRRVLTPMAIVLLVLGLFGITGYWYVGLAAIFLTLSIYLFIVAFNLGDQVSMVFQDIETGILTSRISMFFSVLSGVFIIAGFIFGLDALQRSGHTDVLRQLLFMVQGMLWWLVFAAFLSTVGQAANRYIKERHFEWNVLVISLSLLAIGMIIQGALTLINFVLDYNLGQLRVDFLEQIFIYFVVGITLALVGAIIHRYIRDHTDADDIKEAEWQQ